eukprot:4802658-Pyramimonas_sp.AAC.1
MPSAREAPHRRRRAAAAAASSEAAQALGPSRALWTLAPLSGSLEFPSWSLRSLLSRGQVAQPRQRSPPATAPGSCLDVSTARGQQLRSPRSRVARALTRQLSGHLPSPQMFNVVTSTSGTLQMPVLPPFPGTAAGARDQRPPPTEL